jgi:hypothetical protein
MKWIDEKGRLFGKINIIDLLLIFVVIGAVSFAAIKFLGKENVPILAADKQKTTVTLYGNAIHPFVVDKIKEGDTVRLATNNVVMGKITGIKTGPAILITSTAEGKWVASEVPEKYTVYIDIEGEAVNSNGTLSIGDTPMLVGAELEVKGTNFKMKGIISDVK